MAKTHTEKALSFIGRNAPTIMAGVATVGVVATAWSTRKATLDAVKTLEDVRSNRSAKDISKKEELLLTWSCYVPTILLITGTIGSIIVSSRMSIKRQLALSAAYAISEQTLNRYKDKVVEVLGEKKEQVIADQVAKDVVTNNPPSNFTIIGEGKTLCYESISGRYFQCDIETVRRAQNDINAIIIEDMYASLNEFYDKIGLPPTGVGEELGWTLNTKLDIQFSAILSEDGKPCLCLGYRHFPESDFFKIH